MIITKSSIDEALIAASSELGCSVVDVKYEIIKYPKKGFLGFFRQDAVIKILSYADKEVANLKDLNSSLNTPSIKPSDEPDSVNHASNQTDIISNAKPLNTLECQELSGVKTHMQPAPILSSEQLAQAKEQISELLSFSIDPQVSCSQLECGALSIQITCEDSTNLLGKENFKYPSLDVLLNHYTNINFSVHARVDVNGCLEPMIQELEGILNQLSDELEQSGRASTGVLSPTLLNIAYERIAIKYAHKIINIKDSPAGRFICVWGQYNEHYRTSSKRKH